MPYETEWAESGGWSHGTWSQRMESGRAVLRVLCSSSSSRPLPHVNHSTATGLKSQLSQIQISGARHGVAFWKKVSAKWRLVCLTSCRNHVQVFVATADDAAACSLWGLCGHGPPVSQQQGPLGRRVLVLAECWLMS